MLRCPTFRYRDPPRSGSVVRDVIGPEQQCQAFEDIAHFGRSQNPDAVDEPCAIDRSDLRDIDDAWFG